MQTNWTADSLGWGSCMFEGDAAPQLYWGARAIYEPETVSRERLGYRRTKRGDIMREYKGGPPVWNIKRIVTPARLDFLPDRRGWGGTLYQAESWANLHARAEFQSMVAWLDTVAMPAVKAWVQKCSQSDVLKLDDRIFRLRASCRQSGGYCYIAAWNTNPP